jgi:hypothetical protein
MSFYDIKQYCGNTYQDCSALGVENGSYPFSLTAESGVSLQLWGQPG